MGGGLPLEAITKNAIEKVKIGQFELSLAQVRLLSNVLRTNTSVKYLEFRYCRIGEKIQILAPALGKMTALEELYLGSNEIGDEGEQLLRDAWKEAGKTGNLYL